MMIGQRKQPGYFGVDPMGSPILNMAENPQAAMEAPLPQSRPKANWAGILADALSGAMGRPGQYAAMMNQQRAEQTDFERGERRYQRQRADAQTDWERNKAWEMENRAAPSWEDNAGNRWERRNGENVRVFTDTAPKQYIQDGMLVNVPNPYNSSPLPPPPPTIGEDVWNTGKPLGGPMVSPSGNFRRPY